MLHHLRNFCVKGDIWKEIEPRPCSIVVAEVCKYLTGKVTVQKISNKKFPRAFCRLVTFAKIVCGPVSAMATNKKVAQNLLVPRIFPFLLPLRSGFSIKAQRSNQQLDVDNLKFFSSANRFGHRLGFSLISWFFLIVTSLFLITSGFPKDSTVHTQKSTMEQFNPVIQQIVPNDSNQVPPSLQSTVEELISRMERLELRIHTGTNTPTNVTTKLQSGPYAPIVITNELAQAIQGIFGSSKEVSDHPEPIYYPPEKKASKYTCKVEHPKFKGHDNPSFVEKFSRFLRHSGMQDAPEQQNVDPLVLNTIQKKTDFEATYAKLGTIFPKLENDVTLRNRIKAMQSLG